MRKLAPLLLLVLLGALGWSFASILSIRFSGGEIYPAGSSLRVDRHGTRVLHDSLARLRPVERNFGILKSKTLNGATIFLLNVNAGQLEESEWREFANRGARIVLALEPVAIKRIDREIKMLEVALSYSEPTEEMKDTPAWEAGRETTLSITPRHSAWTVVSAGRILERPYGKGALVLVANADLLSNQSLVQDRASALLARLVGPAQRIIFDESHFGIRDDAGVMVLVRRYGLLGLLAALVTLAALFVWQAAFPLVPLAAETGEAHELQSERTAQSGLSQLLRRGIPPAELMKVCEQEWARVASYTPSQRKAVHQALAEATDPVMAFARATLALERKR